MINIQQCKADLNITLSRVNNFDIKQTKARNICFIICDQHQTRSGKIKTSKPTGIFRCGDDEGNVEGNILPSLQFD